MFNHLKGSKVFIKHLAIKHFTVNREILIELKQMKDLAHENLIRFVGICADDQHISILTEYCEKGNLRVGNPCLWYRIQFYCEFPLFPVGSTRQRGHSHRLALSILTDQ